MTDYLADTHVLLWSLDGGDKLSAKQRRVIDSDAKVFVSVATLWEITIKTSLGKLGVPADFLDGVVRAGFDLLTINTEHIRVLGNLPHHHRDPFDRLLVAQAIAERVTLLTADTQIMRYDVRHL